MENLLFDELFDGIVTLYANAKIVYNKQESHHVFRARQHTVSSQIEDLFAGIVYEYLSKEFDSLKFCCMIDYPVNIGGKSIYPDIAVIVEEAEPTLVSYIDIKTDLGYQRRYFEAFDSIRNKILDLRAAGERIKNVNSENKRIQISPFLKWRTVVISQENLGRAKFADIQLQMESMTDVLDIYFISAGKHPNTKIRDGVNMNPDFKRFLRHIKSDVEDYFQRIKLIS